jgi:phosphate-induced protein 1
MRYRKHPAVLLVAALVGGCSEAGQSPTTAPFTVDGRLPAYASGGGGGKVILPDGHQLDVAFDPNPPARTKNRVDYHGGPVMVDVQNIYFVWYGNWTADPASVTNQEILSWVPSDFCGQPYTTMWRAYTDYLGNAPLGCIVFGGGPVDAYSHGASLSDADVADVVRQNLISGKLPQDPKGIYVVVSSADVQETSGFGTTYCAWHGRFDHNGAPVRFGFLGLPDRNPTNCAPNGMGPNGTVGADAAASHLVGLLSDIVTDPDLTGWSDKLGLEMADKCVWTYGTTYTATNGRRANFKFGQRDYLIQQLWVPSKGGGACQMRP